jgi:hypothetical protein
MLVEIDITAEDEDKIVLKSLKDFQEIANVDDSDESVEMFKALKLVISAYEVE